MVAALLLGLLGSLGHCVGMCGPVSVLIGRGRALSRGQLALAHLGRLSTYVLLGAAAGLLGLTAGAGHGAHAHPAAPAGLTRAQGALALAVAAVALYQAIALLGRAPALELLLAGLTSRWGRAMRRCGGGEPRRLYLTGMLWGLLPCGLVLTALLTAAVAGSPAHGALAMLAFGAGTLPALSAVGWLARRAAPGRLAWPRQLAAVVVALFSAQMAARGLASWGLIDHLAVGSLMLW